MTLQLVLRPTIINPARVQLYYAKAVLSMPLYYAMQYMLLCYFGLACDSTEYRCSIGICVKMTNMCDAILNCPDHTDEQLANCLNS